MHPETVVIVSPADATADDTWKSHVPPRVGYEVEARRLAATGTRTERFVVADWTLADGRSLVLLKADGGHFVLDSTCLVDKWSYTSSARLAMAVDAEREFPRTVDEMIADGLSGHQRRIQADPVYAHHADTLAEKMALARLDAGADELAEVDYSGMEAREVGEPARVGSEVDHAAFRRLDLLKQEKARVKAVASDLVAQIDRLEADLIEQMVQSGQPVGYPVDDRKATIRTDVWGKWLPDVTEAERHAAFREAGGDWADLVQQRINAQTLKSMLAEWEQEHGELPDSLPEAIRRVMTVSAKFSVTFSDVARTRAVKRAAKPAVTPPPTAF